MLKIFSAFEKYPILTGLYSLLLIRYIEFSVWSTILFYQIELYEQTTGETSIPFLFLKSLPYLGLIPIIYAVSGIVIALIIKKSINQTRLSLLVSFLVAIITFGISTFGIIYIRDNLSNIGSFVNGETTYTEIFYSAPFAVASPIDSIVEPFLQGVSIRYVFNPYHTYSTILIIFLILVSTIISLKYQNKNNSQTQIFISRCILFVACTVAIFVLLINGLFYKNAFYPDTWYEKVQNQVEFKVLMPKTLPPGFQQTARFNLYEDTSLSELTSSIKKRTKLITSGYSSSGFKQLANQPTGIVILKQYEIPDGFQLDQIVNTQTNKLVNESIKKITLSDNIEATVISGTTIPSSKDNSSGSSIIKIYLITSDKTLVILNGIISKNFSEEDYIKMANSIF